MGMERGRYVAFSLPRKWMTDYLSFAGQVPTVAVERVLRVRPAANARKVSSLSVGWGALLVKGLALTAARVPELRRALIRFPWPRFYEAPYSVACVVVDREYAGEHGVFFGTMLHPDRSPLATVQAGLDRFKSAPVETVGPFRRLIRTTRLPRPLRRLAWALGLHWSGLLRARYFGTFGVNSMATMRIRLLQTTTPLTSALFYDAVTRDGEMTVQLAFDHRAFDGYTAGRILGTLESVLNGELTAELLQASEARGVAA
jgi:hypothetical protein